MPSVEASIKTQNTPHEAVAYCCENSFSAEHAEYADIGCRLLKCVNVFERRSRKLSQFDQKSDFSALHISRSGPGRGRHCPGRQGRARWRTSSKECTDRLVALNSSYCRSFSAQNVVQNRLLNFWASISMGHFLYIRDSPNTIPLVNSYLACDIECYTSVVGWLEYWSEHRTRETTVDTYILIARC